MSKHATKAAGNVYCQARYQAAETNERLSSREGAAEQLFCGRDVLAKVELDLVRPNPELVTMMADLYNAPELLLHYCANECAIGKSRKMEASSDLSVSQITIKILNSLRGISNKADRLVEIVADGKIDNSERSDIENIIMTLENLAKIKDELVIQYERQFHSK